jgi:hypothetical protein
MKLQNLIHIAPRRIRDTKGIHMMTPHWSRKLCTALIGICWFAIAFPSQSDAYTPRYFTANYSYSYNNYQYYYELWAVYGYNYNTYVLGYAYPYYYMYLAGYKADYWVRYYAAPAYLANAQYYVHQNASYNAELNAGYAQYYWTHY